MSRLTGSTVGKMLPVRSAAARTTRMPVENVQTTGMPAAMQSGGGKMPNAHAVMHANENASFKRTSPSKRVRPAPKLDVEKRTATKPRRPGRI